MRLLALALLFHAVPVPVSHPAQDKAAIRPRAQKRQRVKATLTDKMDGAYTVTTGDQKQELKPQGDVLIRYEDEIVDVDGDGTPIQVKRTIQDWTDKGSPDAKPKGKTLVLKLRDGKTLVEGAELTADDRRKMRLTNVFLTAIPKGDLAVGATWTIEPKDLLRDFEDEKPEEGSLVLKSATATGKFERLEGGRATIAYDFDAAGAMAAGVQAKLKIRATIEVEPATGRLRALAADGTIEVSGTFEEGGVKSSIQGRAAVQNRVTFE